ncbi:hypothetical protein, partial [uncultured Ruminococcus sp.]|uniref:hypothetical protein n=1 Tax=uncultured Ruminococcus sp. TaxID=165186 RepID=UPI0025FCAB3A
KRSVIAPKNVNMPTIHRSSGVDEIFRSRSFFAQKNELPAPYFHDSFAVPTCRAGACPRRSPAQKVCQPCRSIAKQQ